MVSYGVGANFSVIQQPHNLRMSIVEAVEKFAKNSMNFIIRIKKYNS